MPHLARLVPVLRAVQKLISRHLGGIVEIAAA